MSATGRVRVIVRVRPVLPSELRLKDAEAVDVINVSVILLLLPQTTLTSHSFTFINTQIILMHH